MKKILLLFLSTLFLTGCADKVAPHDHIAGEVKVENVKEGTCLTGGSYDLVTYCSICDKVINTENIKTEGKHDWKSVQYDWSEDNLLCTATAICAHDGSHSIIKEVNPTIEISKHPSEKEDGLALYTAIFSSDPFETQKKNIILKYNDLIKNFTFTLIDNSYYEAGIVENKFIADHSILIIPNQYNNLPVKSLVVNNWLNEFGFLYVPKNLESINDPNHNLEIANNVCVDSENNFYDSRDNCHSLIETKTNSLIIGTINTIIPSTICTIKTHAFSHLDPAFNRFDLFVPLSVSLVELNAFYDAPVTLYFQGSNEGQNKTDEKSFYDCDGFIQDNGFSYAIKGETLMVTGCILKRDIVIPSEVGGKKVTSIGYLSHNQSIFSIYMPDTIKRLEEESLMSCRGLTDIRFSNYLEFIGECAFLYCVSLERVRLPRSVKIIEHGAFGECWELKEIFIPGSVETIGGYVFHYSDEVNVYTDATSKPEGWDETWYKAYPHDTRVFWGVLEPIEVGDIIYGELNNEIILLVENNEKVQEIFIPDEIDEKKVTRIYNSAFKNCRKLNKVSLPSFLKQIDENAFIECTELKKIFIPKSVITIKANAFKYCGLKIYCEAEEKPEGWEEGWNIGSKSQEFGCSYEDYLKL